MWYLTVSNVLRLNEAEVGANLLRDFGLLESAVLRPQQTAFGKDAYPGVHRKAAALLDSLIRNHPFIKGNKRTAILAVRVFYGLNGMGLRASPEDVITLALEVARNQVNLREIAMVLETWSYDLDLPEE